MTPNGAEAVSRKRCPELYRQDMSSIPCEIKALDHIGILPKATPRDDAAIQQRE